MENKPMTFEIFRIGTMINDAEGRLTSPNAAMSGDAVIGSWRRINSPPVSMISRIFRVGEEFTYAGATSDFFPCMMSIFRTGKTVSVSGEYKSNEHESQPNSLSAASTIMVAASLAV